MRRVNCGSGRILWKDEGGGGKAQNAKFVQTRAPVAHVTGNELAYARGNTPLE